MANVLTSREVEILAMLARGKTIGEIADAFDLAERSVRAHLQMIIEKLGVGDQRQAVAVALRDGII
jgi:DNA-binding NarL/FixJ family response regulator